MSSTLLAVQIPQSAMSSVPFPVLPPGEKDGQSAYAPPTPPDTPMRKRKYSISPTSSLMQDKSLVLPTSLLLSQQSTVPSRIRNRTCSFAGQHVRFSTTTQSVAKKATRPSSAKTTSATPVPPAHSTPQPRPLHTPRPLPPGRLTVAPATPPRPLKIQTLNLQPKAPHPRPRAVADTGTGTGISALALLLSGSTQTPSLFHLAPILYTLGITTPHHLRGLGKLQPETRDREVRWAFLKYGGSVVEWAMVVDVAIGLAEKTG